jgi:uncharacterized protein (DUF58 family)
MTARGRGILAVGLAVWLVAWLFGSPVLAPVAAGLVLIVPLSAAWVRLTRQRLSAHRRWDARRVVEGDHVRVELRVEPASRIPLPVVVARERVGGLGEREVELRREDGIYRGVYDLHRVCRGLHRFERMRVSISDPWGLAASTLEVDERGVLLVQPRLVALERLFSDDGSALAGGSHSALRPGAGFDVHGVRHHEPGESLRTIHWPSTARTGTLMVKEFEDSARDEIAVLLDGDEAGAVGSPPDSAFDAAVRAAGSILLAHVRRRRRAVLVLNTRGRETQSVAEGVEWDRALGLLAAAMPDARTPAAALLTESSGAAAHARELVVVTPRLDPQLVSRLIERAVARVPVSIVHVDAPTFAGLAPSRQADAHALRLRAAGVAVAVLRHGDDLRETLGAVAAMAAGGVGA